MAAKSAQLQIRVSAAEKAALKRAARRAGLDVSRYVLSRVLPPARARLVETLAALRHGEDHRFVLAEINDLLSGLAPAAFTEAVAGLDVRLLSPFLQNYLSAMVEHAASQKGQVPPAWARDVEPLDDPVFAVPFARLRPHLLRTAPVAFKRRNIFIDATVGDRV
jgi:uncharacterized protein (DUF1778 family)